MPQNPCVIATKAISGEVHIFDYTKHPSFPGTDPKVNPDLRLTGQTKEGYGLSWSPIDQGYLLSASLDCSIALWDINAGNSMHRVLEPLRLYSNQHAPGVEDVAWSPSESGIFASVGDDGALVFWDRRPADSVVAIVPEAHKSDINCVTFNPHDSNFVATGSVDCRVHIWDRRKLSSPVHSLIHHQADVIQIAWSPHYPKIVASASSDRRVAIWDLDRVNMMQSAEDAEDGPPELLFLHGGHCNRVPDLAWNPHRPWMMASVAEDNILQIWQMASEILEDSEQGDEE
jgi:histone-binding protein RBBP4